MQFFCFKNWYPVFRCTYLIFRYSFVLRSINCYFFQHYSTFLILEVSIRNDGNVHEIEVGKARQGKHLSTKKQSEVTSSLEVRHHRLTPTTIQWRLTFTYLAARLDRAGRRIFSKHYLSISFILFIMILI